MWRSEDSFVLMFQKHFCWYRQNFSLSGNSLFWLSWFDHPVPVSIEITRAHCCCHFPSRHATLVCLLVEQTLYQLSYLPSICSILEKHRSCYFITLIILELLSSSKKDFTNKNNGWKTVLCTGREGIGRKWEREKETDR